MAHGEETPMCFDLWVKKLLIGRIKPFKDWWILVSTTFIPYTIL